MSDGKIIRDPGFYKSSVHVCQQPLDESLTFGTVWQCGMCTQKWIVCGCTSSGIPIWSKTYRILGHYVNSGGVLEILYCMSICALMILLLWMIVA